MKKILFFLSLLTFFAQGSEEEEPMVVTKKKVKKNELSAYHKKRNFKKTAEPVGTLKKKKSKQPLFVIQEHAASHLHFDFRLEIDGVLKSWAIPKGPSLDPAIKRLAVETEDHPMEYATFEGIIPKGQYGGGTVMVWDIGTYENVKEEYKMSMHEAYEQGRIEIFLQGKKLKGNFALIHTHRPGDNGRQWIFFKMDDEYASKKRNPVNTQKKSALTGRTMNQIKKEETGRTEWNSK
jgi:DNA ligase D-like protein (predicted 3'-phosphoesterase)